MRKADNLPPSCAVDTKSGNLNFLEPSGPFQACKGTALPFYPQCNNSGTHLFSSVSLSNDSLTTGILFWALKVCFIFLSNFCSKFFSYINI